MRLRLRRACALGVTFILVLALPAIAHANLDGGGGQWAPGRALIKFDAANMRRDGIAEDRIAAEIGAFLRKSKSLKARIVATLPLVPGAYTIEFEGKVPEGLAELAQLDRQQHAKPWIMWEQPDYAEDLQQDAGPTDRAYWPGDPNFWPRSWDNPNSCPGNQIAMGQVNLWPLGRDLRDPAGPWAANNPTPRGLRPGLNYRQIAASSIDVLPVWDALGHKTQPPSGGNGQYWLPQDVHRAGIAIWDSGIANNPDLVSQVAAIVGVGKSQSETQPNTQVTVAYGRGVDLKALRDEFVAPADAPRSGVSVSSDPRPTLFPLDDVTKDNGTPTGCDGHGTEVASVAGAAAANDQGIAGVGWSVPLVGIRPLRPWDDGQTRSVAEAQSVARLSASDAVYDDTLIDQFAVAKALKVPVVNMSFGEAMFEQRDVIAVDRDGKEHEITTVLAEHPAVIEALARGLADNRTLGVASAGRGKYGTGHVGAGASLRLGAPDGVQEPCGLRLLERGLTTLLGYRQVKLGGGGPKPEQVPAGTLQPFAVTGVNPQHLNLICVATNRSTAPELDPGSGSGDAAVDLAAPATNIPVATRPGGKQDPTTWYKRASGTSFAAAEVAGAAALLREAAPGAPMNVIARALRLGARRQVGLLRQVLFGQLDVACSALWLIQNAKPEWHVRVSEAGLGASTQHCFKPSIGTYTDEWTFPASRFDPNGRTSRGPRRFVTGKKLAKSVINETRQALDEQNGRLLPEGVSWDKNELAFFPIESGGFRHPVAPPARVIYDFNNSIDEGRAVVCPGDTELLDINVRMKSVLPQGYVFASGDMFNSPSSLFLNIAMVKPPPVLDSFVPDPVRVFVTYRCALTFVGGG